MEPLPIGHRRRTFILLVGLFVLILPFLFLYAAGYRLNFGDSNSVFISTGGLYVAAERTGAEIYIDEELVRETRAFRRAFYAQGLAPGTHRVHVQKPEHHTWVKELPVYPHLVTEAQAFNLPLTPTVRVISPWRSREGATVAFATSTLAASTTNEVRVVPSRTATTAFVPDTEYATLIQLFKDTSVETADDTATLTEEAADFVDAVFGSGAGAATTTKEQDGVKLFQGDEDVFAEWVGPREQMPYYYCAEDFELAGATPESAPFYKKIEQPDEPLVGPVQSVPADAPCDPVIRLDRQGETVRAFDFFQDSTDFAILALTSGIYVVEVDDRAWQNVQPLVAGEGLDFRVVNNAIYVYDGELIYQVIVEA